MKNNKKNSDINYFAQMIDPKLSLEAKKSVRTTFKLTLDTILDLEWLQKHYNVTIKEIFDYISGHISSDGDFDIEDIINKLKEQPKEVINSPRKTYVLSKGTLMHLKWMSEEFDVSRDDLVSKLIEKLKFHAKTRNESNRKKYKEVYEIWSEFKTSLSNAWTKSEEILGDDDIVFDVEGILVSTHDPLEQALAKLEKLTKEQ